MTGIAAIFEQMDRGGDITAERLLPLVYEELRRLAATRMQRESGMQTLQPTALVHEAWLRLTSSGVSSSWQNQAHFFGAAAQAMRRILVDRSRSKAAQKRQNPGAAGAGGNAAEPPADHILMIHDSLTRLEREDPEASRIVLLKFYSGLSSAEIARLCQSSVRSVERQWTMAKARLYQMIQEDEAGRSHDAP